MKYSFRRTFLQLLSYFVQIPFETKWFRRRFYLSFLCIKLFELRFSKFNSFKTIILDKLDRGKKYFVSRNNGTKSRSLKKIIVKMVNHEYLSLQMDFLSHSLVEYLFLSTVARYIRHYLKHVEDLSGEWWCGRTFST